MKPKPGGNNVDDTTSEAETIVTSATKGEHVNQIKRMFQGQNIYNAYYHSVAISDRWNQLLFGERLHDH